MVKRGGGPACMRVKWIKLPVALPSLLLEAIRMGSCYCVNYCLKTSHLRILAAVACHATVAVTSCKGFFFFLICCAFSRDQLLRRSISHTTYHRSSYLSLPAEEYRRRGPEDCRWLAPVILPALRKHQLPLVNSECATQGAAKMETRPRPQAFLI